MIGDVVEMVLDSFANGWAIVILVVAAPIVLAIATRDRPSKGPNDE